MIITQDLKYDMPNSTVLNNNFSAWNFQILGLRQFGWMNYFARLWRFKFYIYIKSSLWDDDDDDNDNNNNNIVVLEIFACYLIALYSLVWSHQ